MKRSILSLVLATNGLLGACSLANAKQTTSYRVAQNDSTGVTATPAAPTPATKEYSAKGFRVGLIGSSLNFGVKAETTRGQKAWAQLDRTRIDRTLGIGLGYAYIPLRSIGFTAQFSYLNLNDKDLAGLQGQADIYRIDGGAVYAFTEYFHIKGGLNTSHVVFRDSDFRFLPSRGAQAGVGFQFNPNFGLDLMGTYMSQTAEFDTVRVTTSFFGPELTLHATF